jgi:AAA family ATP:ADP antiporter
MTTNRVNWLQAALTFQPGEGRRVAMMILYSAAAIGGVLTIGLAAADALFIAQLPATDMPFILILPAAAIIPVLYVYHRLARRVRLERLIIASDWLLIAIVGVFRALLASSVGKSFAVLSGYFLVSEVAYTLVILQFWTVAGQTFNIREAKRLYGVIAIGGTLANILAGLSLGSLAQLLGVENLLFVVMIALAICAACVRAVIRSANQAAIESPASTAARPSAPRWSFIQDLNPLWRSPLLRAIGGLTVLLSLLINIGAYQFSLSLQANFAGRSADLAAYLGGYEFLAGLAAFLVQFYLASRIMRRFGVLVALLFFPVGMLAAAGLSLITSGALWAMTLTRAVDPIFRRTINAAALSVLYLPAPANLRDHAREIFEILYSISFGLLGVVALVLRSTPDISPVSYSLPVLILGALWLALLRWTKPKYQQALVDSLKKRTLDLEGTTLDLNDDTTVRVLIGALQSPDHLYVLHALKLMEIEPNVDWSPHVVPLLDHPSGDVRIAALQVMTRAGNVKQAETIARLLDSDDENMQAAAIEAYCTINGAPASDRILPYLASSNLSLQSAALTGLSLHGAEAARQAAVDLIDRWLSSGDIIQRCEAVRLIGALPNLDRADRLIDLWLDPQREVKLAAISAASKLRTPELVPHLIEALADVRLADTAVTALVHYGAAIEPEMQRVLAADHFDRAVRAKIPTVLRRLATAHSAEILIAHLTEPDAIVRAAVEVALASLHSDHPEFSVPPEKVRQAVLTEVHDYYALFVLEQDLTLARSDLLLPDTFRTRRRQMLDRALRLLAMLYPNQKIDRVYAALHSKHSSARAGALELLDNVLDSHTKEVLLPMIEAPAARVIELAQRHFKIARRSRSARLTELLNSGDVWLQTCAIYQIGQTTAQEMINAVRQALHADDDVLRESALAAGRSLFEPDQYRRVLSEQAADDHFPVAQQYAREQLRA